MTNQNKTLLIAFSAGVLFSGCKKDDAKTDMEPAPTSAKTTADSVMQETKPLSAEETSIARFKECWGAYNAKDEATLKSCYNDQSEMEIVDSTPPKSAKGADAAIAIAKDYWKAFPDIQSTPQLILVNDKNVVAILHTQGTNRGPMGEMPATGKPISLFQAHHVQLTPQGKVAKGLHWLDTSTMLHQLGVKKSDRAPDSETPWPEKVMVMATDSSVEQENLALAKTLAKDIAEGDREAFMTHVDDAISFRYAGDKEEMKGKEAFKKGFDMWLDMADHEATPAQQWAAGDWVVRVSDAKATLKNDMPGTTDTKGKTVETKQLELMKFADGKLQTDWVFENTGAYPAQLGLMDKAMAKTPQAKDKAGMADKAKK